MHILSVDFGEHTVVSLLLECDAMCLVGYYCFSHRERMFLQLLLSITACTFNSIHPAQAQWSLYAHVACKPHAHRIAQPITGHGSVQALVGYIAMLLNWGHLLAMLKHSPPHPFRRPPMSNVISKPTTSNDSHWFCHAHAHAQEQPACVITSCITIVCQQYRYAYYL